MKLAQARVLIEIKQLIAFNEEFNLKSTCSTKIQDFREKIQNKKLLEEINYENFK